MGKLRDKMEELQKQADEQSKRQIRNDRPPEPRGSDKKRKKR